MIDWIFYNVDPGDLIFGSLGAVYLIFLGYIVIKDIITWFKNRK